MAEPGSCEAPERSQVLGKGGALLDRMSIWLAAGYGKTAALSVPLV